MKLNRIKSTHSLNEHKLTSLVLYTITENEKKPREELENLLLSLGFIKEDDQSTMIHSTRFLSLKPYKFKSLIDDLCKKIQFSDGNFITLINPAHQEIKLTKNNYFYRNIIIHYKYVFDMNSNSFSIIPNKRGLILKVEGKK